MKRFFGAFLVLFFLLYALAERTLKTYPEDGTVHLTWSTDPNPAREIQSRLFAESYPGHRITVDPGVGDNREKVIVQCCSGVGPDIIDLTLDTMASYVDAGILLDLSEYAPAMGFGPENTYPSLRDALTVNGRQYRYPCNVGANVVIYNKRIFDDHDAPYPSDDWTYEDFIRIAKMITNGPGKSGEEHLAVANWGGLWFVFDLLTSFNAQLFSEDGLVCTLDSPEAIAALQHYHDLLFVHDVVPTVNEVLSTSAQGGWGSWGMTLFSVEKAAMVFVGRWYIIQVPSYPGLAENLGSALLPKVGKGPSIARCYTRAAGVNVKSPHWKEALNFLQYLASPQYGELIVKDGDSLPPNPALAQSGKDLVTPIVNDPAFHQTFVDAIETSEPLGLSPFFDATLLLGSQQWFQYHIDLMENGIMSPEDAMVKLANEVNQRIRLNLERRPDLQKKYEAITGKPYRKEWWKEDEPIQLPGVTTMNEPVISCRSALVALVLPGAPDK